MHKNFLRIFIKAFSKYFDVSTVHGLKYLNDGRLKRSEKIFWGIALIVVTIGFFLLIEETTEKLISEKVVIRLSKRQHFVEEIPFPAVTVCIPYAYPSNLYNLIEDESFVSNKDNLEMLNLIKMLHDEDLLSPRNLSYITNKTIPEQLEPRRSSQFKWFYKYAQISWLSRNKVPFTKIVTKWGLCFNFNMIPAEELLNIESISKDLIYNLSSFDSMQKKSSLGTNYPLPWNVSSKGIPLKMTFNQDNSEESSFYTEQIFEKFEDIRVIVHNNDEFPTNPKQSFRMLMGFETNAIVEPQVTLVDDDFRSMSYLKRNCYFPGEKVLKYFKVYTKTNCEQESLSLKLVDVCGCAPFYMIRSPEDKVCDIADKKCINQIENEFEAKGSQCPEKCETVKYQLKISKTEDIYVWNFNFIYNTDFFFPLVKHRAYSFSDYMASIGGLLGLIAGISMFSFIELIYHLIRAFVECCFVKMNSNDLLTSSSHRHQHLQYISNFMKNSSIHGFFYTTNKDLNIFEKLFWSICVIISAVFCVVLVVDSAKHAELNPIIIGIDSKAWSDRDIPFPGLTYCPEIDSIKYQDFLDCDKHGICGSDYISNLTHDFYYGVFLFCGPWRDYGYKGQFCLKVFSSATANKDALNSLETFTEYDWIRKQSYCLNRQGGLKMFPVLTLKGLCFTFGSNRNIFRREVVSKDFFSNKTISGECIVPEAETFQKTFSIDIQANRSSRSLLFETIYIHGPNEIPGSNVVAFEHRKRMSLFINPKITLTDESLRSVNPQRRNCYFHDEKRLRFYEKYNKENCNSECRSNITLEICNCVRFFDIRDEDSPVCVFKDSFCYKSLSNKMFAENNPRFKLCDCLPDCNSIEYDYEFIADRKFGHSDFDSHYDRREDFKNDSTIIGSRITIKFGSDEYFAYKRFESYGTVELISNIGGLLGLFLGISIFSLIEIIYFFTIRLINSYEFNNKVIVI